MSNSGVTALIFEGSYPQSQVEEMLSAAREAALLDNLLKLKSSRGIDRILLYTNRPDLIAPAESLGAEVFLNRLPRGRFHYGEALKEAVKDFSLERVFCLNGAGCPLITVDEIEMVCRVIGQRGNLVYTNNTQSSDIVAFTVPGSLSQAELPAVDNSLALALRDQLGLDMELMPHSLGLLFDIDTPADLLVLGAGPYCGPHVKGAIEGFDLDYSRLVRAKGILGSEYEDILLIGRVGGPVISKLNQQLKLRLRVFSEERGMKSLGRIESGEVVSLLGLLIDHCGLESFFGYLTQVARCAIIDSRVLFYHYGLEPSDEERFLSDLGRWSEIGDPWLRELTRLAVKCPIPVLLGGHSLVAGSLWALCEELKPA